MLCSLGEWGGRHSHKQHGDLYAYIFPSKKGKWPKNKTPTFSVVRPTRRPGKNLPTPTFLLPRLSRTMNSVVHVWKVISTGTDSDYVKFSRYKHWNESRDSSVGIALGYVLDDRGSRVRLPAGGWEFFSSPPCPERLWGPPSLLSNG
jgi:hypothetical protein